MTVPLAVGVSRCLLGEAVRYDGGHRLEPILPDVLGQHLTLVGVCPEVEAGLGVPREPMALEGAVEAPRLFTLHTRRELTDPLEGGCRRRVEELASLNLRGFVLKARSPSCGVTGVPVLPDQVGSGLFVLALKKRLPLLPLIDEASLHDPAAWDTFLQAMFVLDRWLEFLQHTPTPAGVLEFHRRHELLFVARHPEGGVALACLANLPWAPSLPELYGRALMALMARPASPVGEITAMERILDRFSHRVGEARVREAEAAMVGFREGKLPRQTPLDLLNRLQECHAVPYLEGQWYLQPHPVERRLRDAHPARAGADGAGVMQEPRREAG